MKEKLYPISHHFYPILDHELHYELNDYIDEFHKSSITTQDNLIYIHIPYCESICMFCPFHIGVAKSKEEEYSLYTQYLIKEMELLSKSMENTVVKCIYFGGGSPSVLSPENIQSLFEALHKNFRIATGAEITFEGDPISLNNDDLLRVLSNNEVTRISYGIQTFNESTRKLLKIGATLDEIYTCHQKLRSFNFQEINVDMMFYLPGQSIENLHIDLKALDNLGVDSVDYYYLSYYSFPKNYFEKVAQGIHPPRPSRETRQEMYQVVRKYLNEHGFYHTLTSFFSKADEYPEYFRLLWGGGHGQGDANTIAIGASSRGYLYERAYANYTDLKDYYAKIDQGVLPIQALSEKVPPHNRGMVFAPNFLKINQDYVSSEYKKHYDTLLQHQLIEEEEGHYVLTDEGLDWSQNITMLFFTQNQRRLSDKIVDKLENHYSNRVTVYG